MKSDDDARAGEDHDNEDRGGDRRSGDRSTGDRDESESERLDRNWAELLQELRVTQTGTQILTGFLLTIAFQERFQDLDSFQVNLYLVLVIGAIITTIFGLAPVSLHRRLFRQGRKAHVVALANRILQFTLASLAIVLTGTVLFIFDVVVNRAAGLIAAGASAVVVGIVWLLLPTSFRSKLPR